MLGLLGLGSHTTSYYINEINRLFQNKHGGYSTMPFKMLNADFNKINPFLPNQFDTLIPITKTYIEALMAMDVDKIIVPNITLHQTIDQLEMGPEVKAKLIHPVDVAIEKLTSYGVAEIVLFGSKYTMTAAYIRDRLMKAGIAVQIPSKHDQERIDLIRRKVYETGQTKLLSDQIKKVSSNYDNFPILIACTELSILHNSIPQSFDMVQLQIQEAITYSSS